MTKLNELAWWGMQVWHVFVYAVFLLVGYVGFELATGSLVPIGSAYYGVSISIRMEILFATLVVVQGVVIIEAIILGWRRRRWKWCTSLILGMMFLPFALVLAMARIDLWRYSVQATWANVVTGAVIAVLLGFLVFLRRWAWRHSMVQS